MRKIVVLGISLLLHSCQNKEVLLPMANETVVADVKDHSPIYFFLKIEDNDTIIDVNRKNTISSTNWLFNIDRRLPLRKVIIEVKKVQAKKDGSMHKSETAENYFTYTNNETNSLAFFPFTKVKYKLENPDNFHIYVNKYGLIRIGSDIFSRDELQSFLDNLSIQNRIKVYFAYDKNMTFGKYIETKIYIKNLVAKKGILINNNIDYIY